MDSTPSTEKPQGAIGGPLLAIETSAAALSVALLSPSGTLLAETSEPLRHGHAEKLLPAIARLLETAGLTALKLGAVAAAVGPGSFTGIRVGLAAARGIGIGTGIPVLGIPTTEAVARHLQDQRQGRPCLVLLDSRRADVFCQVFAADGSRSAPAFALAPDQIRPLLASLSADGPLVMAGDAAAIHATAAEGLAVEIIPTAPPPARCIGELALEALHRGENPPAAPLYIRPPDAAVPAHGGRLKRLAGL